MVVAGKWDYSERRKSVGRPRVRQEIVDLVLRFAREDPSWGYDRIQGALANLGHHISDQTVGNILKQHGIEPVNNRKRQTTWKTFIKAHRVVLAAIDFTTIEVWTKGERKAERTGIVLGRNSEAGRNNSGEQRAARLAHPKTTPL